MVKSLKSENKLPHDTSSKQRTRKPPMKHKGEEKAVKKPVAEKILKKKAKPITAILCVDGQDYVVRMYSLRMVADRLRLNYQRIKMMVSNAQVWPVAEWYVPAPGVPRGKYGDYLRCYTEYQVKILDRAYSMYEKKEKDLGVDFAKSDAQKWVFAEFSKLYYGIDRAVCERSAQHSDEEESVRIARIRALIKEKRHG